MADWTVPVPYNYNTPYHAYAYSLMYQTVQNLQQPEQNHPGLSGWSEAAAGYNNSEAGYYPTTTRDESSPPESPEQNPGNSNPHHHHHHGGHYIQGSGVVYFGGGGDPQQAGRLFHRSQHDARHHRAGGEAERAGSSGGTPTSDSSPEAHTSPESWSSSSSREGSVPQSDPTTWPGTNLDDESHDRRSKPVSSSDHQVDEEEPQQEATLCVADSAAPSSPTPVSSSTQSTKSVAPKAKTRTAFSENQMKTLTQRFSVQRYLTQAEMKNLAAFTGLSYKQVKTWFQNRRMKLRRHQKDTSWVSERYTVNKNDSNPIYASMPSHIPNMPPHIQAYQGETQAHLQEQYSQQMREAAALKNPTPAQNLSYYLASVGAATGGGSGAGYPHLPSPGPCQPGASRPQAADWPVEPPGVHYKYNPNDAVVGNDSDTSFDGDEGNPTRIPSPLGMTVGHGAGR